jgi:hypothetical protein
MSQTCTAPPRGAFNCRRVVLDRRRVSRARWLRLHTSRISAGSSRRPSGHHVLRRGSARHHKAASIALWRAGEDVAAIEAGRLQAEQPACGPTGACRTAPDATLAQLWIRRRQRG